MADHTLNGMQAAIKSLREVVAPAVDATNPLAVEQLRMACKYLSLICEDLPYRSGRIRFEFQNAKTLGHSLRDDAAACGPEIASELEAALGFATEVAKRADAMESELVSATTQLTAVTTALVRSAAHVDPVTRQRIERAVVANAKRWLDVQRAWFRPLGFESGEELPPPLAEAIAAPFTS